jgi:FkbM family methyltransferase
MSFISYAQNGEDVMLWRALGHVEGGFYIDVGANHPDDDSVTRAFYDRGWHGINIEPLPGHHAQLLQRRPRDINLRVAAGSANGAVDLYDTPVRGLATASPEVAARHGEGGLPVASLRVPLCRLDDLCAQHAPTDIHFLKVDVEGYEGEVLAGMDFRRFRPWIVVVEATLPNSREVSAGWEPSLLAAGYQRVWFDGLNRYYVADEHPELHAAFDAPPNVFDDYIPVERLRLQERLDQAQHQLGQAVAHERELEARIEEIHGALVSVQSQARITARQAGYAHALQHELQQLRSSTSWRVTHPLRAAVAWVRAWLRPSAGPALSLLSTAPEPGRVSAPAPRFDHTALPARPALPEAPHLALAGETVAVPWFRITGHIEGHYSLAIVNRGLALALDRRTDGRVRFVPCHHVPYASPRDLPRGERRRLRSLIARPLPAAEQAPVFSIVHHYPLVVDAEPARHRVAIFFWEETCVPGEMVQQINESFEALLVASRFVKQVLLDSGCRLPVFVIPLGVDQVLDPAIAHASAWRRTAHALLANLRRAADLSPMADLRPRPGRHFRYLHVSSAFPRKGVDLLLQAFFEQFTAADPVELVIKTFPNPHNDVHAQLARLQAGRFDAPRVIVDESPLGQPAMAALYRSAQVLVLPTRGEGFNLPAAEAMALGLPVLATGYGAHADFCTRDTATLIPWRFERAASHLGASDACWAEPDVQALGTQMRELFHRIMGGDPTLEQQRQQALRHVRVTYRWDAGARGIERVAAWLDNRPAPDIRAASTRIAVLSPWATRCGVGEYATGLLSGLASSPAFTLDVWCDTRTTPEQAAAVTAACCRPAWSIGDAGSVLAALRDIAQTQPAVLVVQHQPSLFRLDADICVKLDEIRRAGCIVILELHSTQQLLFEHRLSPRAIGLLRGLDRIVVHQPGDLNNLLALGLAANLMQMPLGILQPLADRSPQTRNEMRRALGIAADELVVGSFGFLFPHKGIDTLIRSLALLAQAVGRPVRLLCVNSTPDAPSRQTLLDYQQLAQELGVAERIVWRTDYLPITECQRLLDAADCIVLPYKDTRESASAAVTVGLSSGKPVLVSPLHIFDDLGPVTRRLGGFEVEHVVEAVTALIQSPEAIRDMQQRQQDWLRLRSTTALAERFSGTVQGLLSNRFVLADAPATAQAKALARPRLLVDVSELYHRDARTGIQRVVRSVLAELLAHPPAGYEVRPVHALPGTDYRHTGRFGTSAGAAPVVEDATLHCGEGDIFLGLDLGAHLFPASEGQLIRMRAAGVRLHFVIYDLIPLRHPQYCDQGLTTAFAHWMNTLGRQADGLHCISAAVAEDVRAWLYQHVRTLPLPEVSHFHLGADIESSAPTQGLPEDAASVLAQLNAPGHTFLSVGTIEPRKGQAQLLDAFEVLWKEQLPVRLVLAGKAGWKVESLVARLRAHPELGRRLFWLEGISDEYLERLYAASDCLLAASEVEGFGLPLIEAAQRGVPILARDIPVFREVAGAHASYFSGNRADELALAVQGWLSLARQGTAPSSAGLPWLTWQQSTQALLQTLLPAADE